MNLSIQFDLSESIKQLIGLEYIWKRNGAIISEDEVLREERIDCTKNYTGFNAVLCAQNGTVGPYSITVTAVDDNQGEVNFSWNITYFIWHPPEPVIEQKDDDSSSGSSGIGDLEMGTIASIIAGVIVIALLLILLWVRQGRPEVTIPNQPPPTQGYQYQNPQQYSNVPSAPVLPDFKKK